MLEQLGLDNRYHVIAYASKTCTPAESRYASTDGELLALIYGIHKFHHYLAGAAFTVVTDHQALTYLEQAKCQNSRLARWAVKLSVYDFKIQYRPGVQHRNADGLTRAHKAPQPDPITIDALTLLTQSREDSDLKAWETVCGALDDALDDSLPLLTPPTAVGAVIGPR